MTNNCRRSVLHLGQSAIPSCRLIGSRTSGGDRLSLSSLNEYVGQAGWYFRGSVENQQAFDSEYSAASWLSSRL
jgi:hypothetical protein